MTTMLVSEDGEIIGHINPGDRIVRKASIEHLEETIEWGKGWDFVKTSFDVVKVYRDLNTATISVMAFLIPYISNTGLLKIPRGNPLDNQRIALITKLTSKTISKSMDLLVNHNLLFRVRVGKHYNYIANSVYFQNVSTLSPWRKEHARYISSTEWKSKRELVLIRDNHTCQHCDSIDNLQVHHLTYDNFKNEPMQDLVTLCNSCHSKIHNKSKE